jgi:hypothetical protein
VSQRVRHVCPWCRQQQEGIRWRTNLWFLSGILSPAFIECLKLSVCVICVS